MKLQNKKAIVTGANRSIGKAIALAFAREGADVAISYRSDEKGANETIREIENLGRRGKAFYADFLQAESTEIFFRNALEFLGSLNILVNNAAGYNTAKLLDIKISEFEDLLQLGVTVPMILTQLSAKHMIENGINGVILNISSISGNRPYKQRVAHSTAKSALNMLTQVTALELAPYNIRVNAIAPGNTPYEGDVETNADNIPLKRVGKPEEQAAAAVFLASEQASWITGQIITIDGGQSLSFY